MYTFRLFIPGFVACALLVAGCSQPDPVATAPAPPDPPPPVAEEGPAASPIASPTTEPAPAVDSTSETPLPEVRAVNTAELGEVLEKTLGKVTVLNLERNIPVWHSLTCAAR